MSTVRCGPNHLLPPNKHRQQNTKNSQLYEFYNGNSYKSHKDATCRISKYIAFLFCILLFSRKYITVTLYAEYTKLMQVKCSFFVKQNSFIKRNLEKGEGDRCIFKR